MSEKDPTQTAASLTQWTKAATHYPLCPSGVRVGIRIPDLPALIESGEIPQHLVGVALGVANGDLDPTEGGEASTEKSIELVKATREYTDRLVQLTVVEPKLDSDSVKRVPFEDKDFIVAVATRQRDLDAEGEHIAGLTKSEKFRRFRRLGEFTEDVEGL